MLIDGLPQIQELMALNCQVHQKLDVTLNENHSLYTKAIEAANKIESLRTNIHSLQTDINQAESNNLRLSSENILLESCFMALDDKCYKLITQLYDKINALKSQINTESELCHCSVTSHLLHLQNCHML